MPDFSNQPATEEKYNALRAACGLSPFSLETSAMTLKNTEHGVWLRHAGTLVGMGRLVGDGAAFVQVTDIAVHPIFQRQGHGQRIMGQLMEWADKKLPDDCYISLIADAGAEPLYQKFGFQFRTGIARIRS